MERDFKLSDITPELIVGADVDLEYFGLLMRKLADQHGDDLGPGDPYLAAFFAYVEVNGIEPGEQETRPNIQLEDHLKISSAVNRFFALGELEQAGHLKHWIKEKEDHIMLHPSMIEAACKTQLLAKGETFYFQPLEFLNNALSSVTPNEPF